MPDDDDEIEPLFLPGRVIADAYLLALVCVLVPFGVIGVAFVGAVLARRGLRGHAAAVIALGIVCAILGWTVAR
jgi:hypothetical protein